MLKYMKQIITMLFVSAIVLMLPGVKVSAETFNTEIEGYLYKFDKNSDYEFSNSELFESTTEENTYGTFFIAGDIVDISTYNGVPAYMVEEGDLELFYNYGDNLIHNADKDVWHIIEDKGKKIDVIKLDDSIQKGAIVIQTSNDRMNWVDVYSTVNAFWETPIRTESIYETTEVQMLNGCYYRVIVAYEQRVRTEDNKILFINTDKYDYKKYAEVYEFYACSKDTDTKAIDPDKLYNLGGKS